MHPHYLGHCRMFEFTKVYYAFFLLRQFYKMLLCHQYGK